MEPTMGRPKPEIEKDIYYLLNCADDGEVYVRVGWARLKLAILVGPDTTRENILSTIKAHDMVISCLAAHSGDECFKERYFHTDGEVRYFTVLELAEKELKSKEA